MNDPLAYCCGHYIPQSELAISPFDIGFMQGVTVTERGRSFGGKLFRWDAHLRRLRRSLEIIECVIPQTDEQLTAIALELMLANRQHLPADADLGICLLVTPGVIPFSQVPADPTVVLHTLTLDYAEFARLYAQGQPLVISSVQQVSARSWPPELKCRSRMHYYLADRQARQAVPGGRALLLDEEGYVSEASTANLLAYFAEEGVVSPPLQKILPGVTLQVLQELAGPLQLPWRFRDLRPEELLQADELLLCSTSPCVVPVTSVDGQPVGNGVPGEVFRRFLGAWSELVGFDIEKQAARYAR
jgi:branched-subunit amino acid aminotransferase/4-amino-4-deoxychorismate lyase